MKVAFFPNRDNFQLQAFYRQLCMAKPEVQITSSLSEADVVAVSSLPNSRQVAENGRDFQAIIVVGIKKPEGGRFPENVHFVNSDAQAQVRAVLDSVEAQLAEK